MVSSDKGCWKLNGLYARQVVGWAMDATMETGLVLRAMAPARRQPTAGRLQPAEQGSQDARTRPQAAVQRQGEWPA